MRTCARTVCALLLACSVTTVASKGHQTLVFGDNANGPLGTEAQYESKPVSAGVSTCVRQALVNSDASILVTCDGSILAFGSRFTRAGVYSAAKTESFAAEPVSVSGLVGHNVAMAGMGDGHFIALTTEGKVFTWGHNHDGQLGWGGESVPFSGVPVEVESLAKKNIRFVTAGGNRSAALTDDGRLFMWGSGKLGEMGDGSSRSHKRPTHVSTLNNNGQRVCQVSLGGNHVAAVTNAGDLFTWGDGANGQLGLGSFGMLKRKPTHVPRLRRNVCYVSTGRDFSSVITKDDRIFLWGSNGFPSPFEKVWFQGMKPVQVGSGQAHMVVLLKNGTVGTWGSSRAGQRGRDAPEDFTLEPGFVDTAGAIVRQIATGPDQTMLVVGDIPAPTLCPCGSGFYSYWRKEIKYTPTCTDDQVQCGDGSCCGSRETCCLADPSATPSKTSPFLEPRAIDEPISVKSEFKCAAGESASCCGPFACANGYACNAKDQRCDLPKSQRGGLSDEDLAVRAEAPVRLTTPKLPGFEFGKNGVCGARKETCPDESCCGLGQTCCPKADGSFGCCKFGNASCCSNGCCAEGHVCDDNKNKCVRLGGYGAVPQEPVQGQCGARKRACPDSTCCQSGAECCILEDGFFGCCPFKNGVCCADGAGCCPSNHQCDVKNSKCVHADNSSITIPMKATPRNTPQRPSVSATTCSDQSTCPFPGMCCEGENGRTSCCAFMNGTCCEGGLGCCPSGFSCDVGGQRCVPNDRHKEAVPMRFTRASTPKQHPEARKPPGGVWGGSGAPAENDNLCPGQTQCDDNSCCAAGSTCCEGKDGKSMCCDSMQAVCCAGGGCCKEGDSCNSGKGTCTSKSGGTYGFLSSEPSTPAKSKQSNTLINPGKCYSDERLCPDSGLCCPRGSTCCSNAFGEFGCCPMQHGVCCQSGGCCPGGSTCDNNQGQCSYTDGRAAIEMLAQETARAPEAEYDIEECYDDEQTCADGGCCLNSNTCCTTETAERGVVSSCCPFENGVCCENGMGCCPEGSQCDIQMGTCVNPGGSVIADLAVTAESTVHPFVSALERDCGDGYVCGAFETCCSLGYDEYWGEEVFGCCPFENGVCCSEFEGCCPTSFECDAETKSCSSDDREFPVAQKSNTEPPPTFVCDLSKTQCSSGKCCDADQYCVPYGQGHKCVDRGFAFCGNGSHACPEDLYCEQRNNKWVCSEEQDNDPAVKERLIAQYWGDDVNASCAAAAAAAAALIQQDAQKDFTPKVKQETAKAQFWYPKKLVAKSVARPVLDPALPSVLAEKICQHLHIVNSANLTRICYTANANGRFLIADRPRVKQLVEEYKRRICEQQSCNAPEGKTYEFVPEEINPCPCRVKPTGEVPAAPGVVPGDGEVEEAQREELEKKESETAQVFSPPDAPVKDDKPASADHIGKTGGAVAVTAEPNDDQKYTLVPSAPKDKMQSSQLIDNAPHTGDAEMLSAHKVEPFMGKEGCHEDTAETAVDLDGDDATSMDKGTDAVDLVETLSLTQMDANAKHGAQSLMPEA